MAGPALLEREHELSELADAVRDAAAGDGGLVLIAGEAGICKSSLVRAVRGLLPAEGRVLAGEAPIRRLASDAGFTRFRRVAETPFNLGYEARP